MAISHQLNLCEQVWIQLQPIIVSVLLFTLIQRFFLSKGDLSLGGIMGRHFTISSQALSQVAVMAGSVKLSHVHFIKNTGLVMM